MSGAPIFIRHRVNAIADLSRVDPAWGVEIDLRSDVAAPGNIHLSHDPWKRGDDFGPWLDEFKKRGITGPIILNTKEDGLEETLIGAMKQAGIESFFFLDTALPTLVRWTIGNGERRGPGSTVSAESRRPRPTSRPSPRIFACAWSRPSCMENRPTGSRRSAGLSPFPPPSARKSRRAG
jgi:hypothetical protein